MTDPRLIVLFFIVVLAPLLSGCVTDPSLPVAEEDPCPDGYPSRQDLDDRWSQMSKEVPPAEVAVLVLGAWKAPVQELPPERVPEHVIDWAAYDPAARPAVIHDLLCYSLWRIETKPRLADGFSQSVNTPRGFIWDTLDDLAAEQERQTGVPIDWRQGEWPDIVFHGRVYLPWCHGWVSEYEDGRSEGGLCLRESEKGPTAER